ncbi:MAG: DUF6493 family protein [Janthinobacterium lividum]
MTAADTLEHLIRHQGIQELLPFLLALPKTDVVPVRAKTLSLAKELEATTFEQVTPDTSRSVSQITLEQRMMLNLAKLRTYSQQEARERTFFWQVQYLVSEQPAAFWQVLESARPAWLQPLLLRHAAEGRHLPYPLLRELESRGFLPFEPALFAGSVPGLLHSLGPQLSGRNPVPADARATIVAELQADATLLRRDLPLVFDFATDISYGSARVQPLMPEQPSSRDASGRYPWQVWNELHPLQTVTWLDVLPALAAAGHLDRADLLTRCLLALRRDFKRPLLTWFKDVFVALEPTVAERLACQNELTELLLHPLAQVVNFALGQVHELWDAPGFEPAPVLLPADAVLGRADLKASLLPLLTDLGRLARQQPAHAPAVARLLASALAHPHRAAQTQAAKALAALLTATPPLLPPATLAEAAASIHPHHELLAAPARAHLAPWLTAATPGNTAPATPPPTAQNQAPTPILPVADWHELLYLTGQVLNQNNPTVVERWLDGLLRLQGQLLAGYAQQLQPYLTQLLPPGRKDTAAELNRLLTGPSPGDGHDGLLVALLLGWATGFERPRVADVPVQGPEYPASPLLVLEKQRYQWLETLLRRGQALPLLSTPTHAPHWLAPSALVQRLLAYEAAATAPDVADLALALARTHHADAPDAAAARALLPQLPATGLRELLGWLLADALLPLPAPAVPAAQPFPATVPATVAEALPALWAVAARTKAPAAEFPALASWLGLNHAGVTRPLQTALVAEAEENHYQDYASDSPVERVYHWTRLSWRTPDSTAEVSPLLLYAPVGRDADNHAWERHQLLAAEFGFYAALLPNYPAPVYEYVLRCAAWADKLETAERDLLAQALRWLLLPGPPHDPTAHYLLAAGLLHHTALCRSLTQEALLQAAATSRLDAAQLGRALAELLATGCLPAPRLAAALTPLLALDAPTDDVLGQVLEAMLPALPTTAPRQLRPVLELYADLLARLRRPVPAAVREQLAGWAKGPLRPLVKGLLAAA